MKFLFYCSGPWLLFVSESGYGKRVPLSSFRQLPLNRVGLIGYKVWWILHLLNLYLKCIVVLLNFFFSSMRFSMLFDFQFSSEDQLAAVFVVGFSLAGNLCYTYWVGVKKFHLISLRNYHNDVSIFHLQKMVKVMSKWFWWAKVVLLIELKFGIFQYSLVMPGINVMLCSPFCILWYKFALCCF